MEYNNDEIKEVQECRGKQLQELFEVLKNIKLFPWNRQILEGKPSEKGLRAAGLFTSNCLVRDQIAVHFDQRFDLTLWDGCVRTGEVTPEQISQLLSSRRRVALLNLPPPLLKQLVLQEEETGYLLLVFPSITSKKEESTG